MVRHAGMLIVGLALVGFLMTGCKTKGPKSGSPTVAKTSSSDCSGCAKMMAKGTGWCNSCDKGVVKGNSVKCWGCYVGKTGGNECSEHKERK